MGIPAILSSVPNVNPYIQYVATNGQTVFPFPFPLTQDSDLVVVINGVTQPTDSGYTLSGVGQANGGNLTFTAGQTGGAIITMFRNIAIQRITQITQNSGYSSTALNAEYNNIYLLLQQLQESIALCLQIPNTNSPAPVTRLAPASYANTYLAFDANGNPTPALLTSSGSITGGLIASLLSAVTTAAPTADKVRTPAEIAAGVMPVNFAFPSYDLRRLATPDGTGNYFAGTVDDTAAVQNACLVGGEWKLPSGAQVRVTSTITVVRAVCFYSNSPTSPASSLSPNYPQTFLVHDFNGTFFNLVASASDAIVGSGVTFERICLLQKNGNGTGASGIAINAVATSDVQKSPWVRIIDCNIENMSGANDWTWGVVLDGLANSSGGVEERDCFIHGCRFVSGANATGSVKLNGAANIFLSEIEANLQNGNLVITGNSTRQSLSIFVTNTTWNAINIDWATGVEGDGNTAGTVTTTGNSQNINIGCTTGASPPTILGSRIYVHGITPNGKYTVSANNNIRYEIGMNPLELSGPVVLGTNPAATGDVRLANSGTIKGRNAANSGDVVIATVTGGNAVALGDVGISLGFYGISGTTKPAITGAKGGNAALASLLTALAAQGLLTDSTT